MSYVSKRELEYLSKRIVRNLSSIVSEMEEMIDSSNKLIMELNKMNLDKLYFLLTMRMPIVMSLISKLLLLYSQMDALKNGIYMYKGGKIEWGSI